MTTSGTTNFTIDIAEAVEEAAERAGVEARSGYALRSARRSLNILMAEWQNRGLNLWTIDSGSIALTPGTAAYDLPTDTVDVIEYLLRTNAGSATNQADYILNRISVADYSAIPNKLLQGRPLQLWVRRTDTPGVTLWPVPDNVTPYTFVYYRLRRMQDAGNPVTNTFDMPLRFAPALVAGLAYYMALKAPKPDAQRTASLKALYEEQFEMAAGEDRDRASVRFLPYQEWWS